MRALPGPEERFTVKPSRSDCAKGKFHQLRGLIRQKLGELANNPRLAASGRAEKIAGRIQNLLGRIEKSAGV
jgi:uncharacterized protein YjbJ (UPF0337 family)